MIRLFAIACLVALAVVDEATALSYRFDLIARTVDDTAGVTGLGIGDPLTIEIGFDENPVDQVPQLETRGNYIVRDLTYRFPSGDFVGQIDDDLDARITIFANDPVRDALSFGLLRLSVAGTYSGTNATLAYGNQIALSLTDSDGIWLEDDSFPTDFLELDEYEFVSQSQIRFTSGTEPTARVNTTLVGISVVPEPSTGLLASLGILWIACGRHSKTYSHS